jgi:hypothetical protein
VVDTRSGFMYKVGRMVTWIKDRETHNRRRIRVTRTPPRQDET